jgi:hypothetical protein
MEIYAEWYPTISLRMLIGKGAASRFVPEVSPVGGLNFGEGVSRRGALTQDDSFIIDLNWSLPFRIGSGAFSVDGHAETIGARDDEFGNPVAWHFLAQPQVRFDIGKAAGGSKGRVFVGTEVQFWTNKLGDPDTDEFVPQALVVWRF